MSDARTTVVEQENVRFSVVIPTRRRPDLVVQAVHSVMQQTVGAHEIIVVIDGLDPPTERALRSFTTVTVIALPQNKGVAEARNIGVREATGNWMCFLDDDDLWSPDHLEVLRDSIRSHHGCQAVQAGFWSFGESLGSADLRASDLDSCLAEASKGDPWPPIDYIDLSSNSYDALLERNRGVISTATVQRSLLLPTGGFPAGAVCAEDWAMQVRVARLTHWHSLQKRLAFVRVHPGNNTHLNWRNGLATLEVLRDLWADPDRDALPHRSLHEYGLHYRLMVQGAFWAALKVRRPAQSIAALRIGWSLLPRRRDRIYALLPVQLTWRWDSWKRRGSADGDRRDRK